MSSLVSIISPCYNGETFVSRFLESILSQTYDNIEFIIINDGSTDRTEEIILSYQKRFEDRGYSFTYIKQENSGQSEAINKGLKIFTGDYLTWLDSDDFLPKNAIQKKVEYLDLHSECGTALCKVQVVKEGSFKNLFVQERIKPDGKDEIFYDLLLEKNAFISCGSIMVRSSMFRMSMPNPLIIDSAREIGQNFQLILPIVYKFPVGYIDEICYFYVIRSGSHSHTHHSYIETDRIIEVSDSMLNKITSELTNDPIEKKRIKDTITYRKFKLKLRNILIHNKKENLKVVVDEMKRQNVAIDSELLQLIRCINSRSYSVLIKVKNVIKRTLKIFVK